jgi:hypothetical protein
MSTMHPDRPGRPSVASGVVAALFLKKKHVCDAVSDLNKAGFDKGRIRVAYSTERPGGPDGEAEGTDEHSMSWRLRHSFNRDLHHQGAEIVAAPNEQISNPAEPLYSVVNLHDCLQAMGLTEARIGLIDHEIGPEGALMLIDAGERWKEATTIVERDCADVRTDTATERPSSAA